MTLVLFEKREERFVASKRKYPICLYDHLRAMEISLGLMENVIERKYHEEQRAI